MRTRWIPALLIAAMVAGTSQSLWAETNSYYNKAYDYRSLKTFAFKDQRRISSDPIANNEIWANDIRGEVTRALQSRGYEQASSNPDFLVAFYVGLQQGYDTQYLGYGFPGFWGGRRLRGAWAWGWPNGVDVWSVPYTDSTLIVDIIDGKTNQLIWRGYDTNTIDMKNPDKRLDKAVDSLVTRFVKNGAEHS